jgi:hypothetical protein
MQETYYIYVRDRGYLGLDAKGNIIFSKNRQDGVTVDSHDEALALMGIKSEPYNLVQVL